MKLVVVFVVVVANVVHLVNSVQHHSAWVPIRLTEPKIYTKFLKRSFPSIKKE